jgi:hypothetical protein
LDFLVFPWPNRVFSRVTREKIKKFAGFAETRSGCKSQHDALLGFLPKQDWNLRRPPLTSSADLTPSFGFAQKDVDRLSPAAR